MLLALLASFSILMASGSSLQPDCEDISSSGNIASARHLINTVTLHLYWQVEKSAVNFILWSSNYHLPNPSTCSRWRSMASLSRRWGAWESEGRMYKPPSPTELSEWTAEQFFWFRKLVNIIGQFGQASLKIRKGWTNVNTPKRSRFLTGLTALQAISIVTCFLC